MTTDELAYYQQTLLARLARLWRLGLQYNDDLPPNGRQLLYRAYVATIRDCFDAGISFAAARPYLSFAPPPPAKPSPEGRP